MTRARYLSPETTRLAAQAAAFARGQAPEVLAWLERLGCRIVHRRDAEGEWILDGPSGVRAGLSRGLEPVAAAVQLGVLFAGPFWPVAFPHLVETADRLGRAEAPPRSGPRRGRPSEGLALERTGGRISQARCGLSRADP